MKFKDYAEGNGGAAKNRIQKRKQEKSISFCRVERMQCMLELMNELGGRLI